MGSKLGKKGKGRNRRFEKKFLERVRLSSKRGGGIEGEKRNSAGTKGTNLEKRDRKSQRQNSSTAEGEKEMR